MPIRANVEGIGTLVFPDDTPDEVINETVRQEVRSGIVSEGEQAKKSAERTDTVIKALDWASALTEGATPEGLLRSAGRVSNYIGGIAAGAAEDVIAGQATPTSLGNVPNPLGPRFEAALLGERPPPSGADTPLEQGVVDAVKAGAMLLTGSPVLRALGAPVSAAFATPMAAGAYEAALEQGADRPTALAQAAQTGLLTGIAPGMAGLGAEGMAAALGQAVQRGLLSGKRTVVQKTMEMLAGQGVVQGFMTGVDLQAYLDAPPEQRMNMLVRNMVANTAFMFADVPNLLRKGPSLTQQGLAPKVREVLEEMAKDPAAMEELLKQADEAAVEEAAKKAVDTGVEVKPAAKPEADPAIERVKWYDSVWGKDAPVAQETAGEKDVKQARWLAIENTYKTAKAAQEIYPGVPLKDIVLLRVFRKGESISPKPDEAPTVDALFVRREEQAKVRAELEAKYPATEYGMTLDPGLEPYQPRKGEPTFKQWMAGERPGQKETKAKPETQTESGGSDEAKARLAYEKAQAKADQLRAELEKLPKPDKDSTDDAAWDTYTKAEDASHEASLEAYRAKEIWAKKAKVKPEPQTGKVLPQDTQSTKKPDEQTELEQAAREELAAEQETWGAKEEPTGGSPGSPETAAVPEAPVNPGTLPVSLIPRTQERTIIERVRRSMEAVVQAAGGDVVTRSRRFYQRALGIYKPHSAVVRLRHINDLATQAHEIAHALDASLWRKNGGKGVGASVPQSVKQELVARGKILYGNRRPAWGYAAEGWSEFMRFWLTSDGAAQAMPATTKWFENVFRKSNPEVAAALDKALSEVNTWRNMGEVARVDSQMREHVSPLRRQLEAFKEVFTVKGLFESGTVFHDLVKLAEQHMGKKLAPSLDPYQIFTRNRGSAGVITSRMIHDGMLDIWGRKTGGMSLRQALAPVTSGLQKGETIDSRAKDFWRYAYGRRAQERWSRGFDPGIPLAAADQMVQQFQRPEFDLAFSNYTEWWDGVLDYVASSSPNMEAVVEAIRDGSTDYVPLARVVEGPEVRRTEVGASSNALKRFRGSARAILHPQLQTLLSAERLVSAAHREQIMHLVFRLADNVPGMGRMIEEVPKERVMERVNIDAIRKQVEDFGIDTTAIPDGTLFTWYQAGERPHGLDPIVVRRTPDGPKWYQVSQDLFDALATTEPRRSWPIVNLLLYAPAKMFKLGTTGLRPSFGLATNLFRDAPTYLAQSYGSANQLRRVAEYFGAMGEVLKSELAGRTSPELEAFKDAGVTGGTFLGGDIQHARRESRALFHGRTFRAVRSPLEWLRERISLFESVPRYAEWRSVGRTLGWAPGRRLTPDQAVAMAVAAKRVTTDFSARGSFGGDPVVTGLMSSVPFASAALQGMRTFGRVLKERPVQSLLYGLSTFTLPTLVNWWRNKDELWYRALPTRERHLYWNVSAPEGNVVQIPKPPDWGNLFSVIPEALLDRAYQLDPQTVSLMFNWLGPMGGENPQGGEADPEVVTKALGHVLATSNPIDLPVLGKLMWEQARNRVAFWDRPIVPKAQEQLQPGEQVAPYTSWFARELGKMFPSTISPRRVDHAVRALTGGALADAVATLELGAKAEKRGLEAADFPVYGRLFRRGGEFSSRSQILEDAYDLAGYWNARRQSKQYPPSPREQAFAEIVEAKMEVIRTVQQLVEQSNDPAKRREAYRKLTIYADGLVKDARKYNLFPTQVELPPPSK